MKPLRSSNPLPLATATAEHGYSGMYIRWNGASRELAVPAEMFMGGKMEEMEVLIVQEAWGREVERKDRYPFSILEIICFGQNYHRNFSFVSIIRCDFGLTYSYKTD